MTEPDDEAAFERSVASEVQHDLRNDNKPAIERHFEDLLDEIHTSHSSSTPVGGPNQEERDEAERAIREFCNVLGKACAEALGADTLTVRHVMPEEAGVVVTAEDGMRNSWQVTHSWEGIEQTRAELGDGPRFLSAVAGRVCCELRDARRRWWAGKMPIKRRGKLH